MSSLQSFWRVDQPHAGMYTSELMDQPSRPVRTFLPEGYERRYAYPLLVIYHAEGSAADAAVTYAPLISQRNYIAISLQGARLNTSGGFAWEQDAAELVEHTQRAIAQTRLAYHIHSERIFLVGLQTGSAAAFRVGFELADKLAGVVGISGGLPSRSPGQPLFRWQSVRQLHAFLTCRDTDTPIHADYRLLNLVGTQATLRRYRTSDPIHPAMLADVNRWIMQQIMAEPSKLKPQHSH